MTSLVDFAPGEVTIMSFTRGRYVCSVTLLNGWYRCVAWSRPGRPFDPGRWPGKVILEESVHFDITFENLSEALGAFLRQVNGEVASALATQPTPIYGSK